MTITKDSGIYRMMKMTFHGMTMDDFKIFAYLSSTQVASWDEIQQKTGCTETLMANALNKLCSSKSVSGSYRYGLIKKTAAAENETSFALTEKGQKFSKLFQ